MQRTFQHTYQDGAKLTLTIAFSSDNIAVICDPQAVEPHHEAEYVQWRDEVVLPGLMDDLDPEYVAMFAELAAQMIEKA